MAVGASAVAALVALLAYSLGWASVAQLVLVALVAYLAASGSWRWFYVAAVTTPRDLRALAAYVRLLLDVRRATRSGSTVPDMFDRLYERHPDKACFLYEDQVWSYARVRELSARFANAFRERGYGRGKAVALMAPNCPQYPAAWTGLARLGVVVPLINTNQRSQALVHSLRAGRCDALVYAREYRDAVREIADRLDPGLELFEWSPDGGGDGADLSASLAAASPEPPPRPPDLGFHDPLLYIYTSGTTGLPKAAVITHSRYAFMAGGIHHVCGLDERDVIYTSLPLYHSAGCITAVGQALVYGSTVAVRAKFSASNFIKDCVRYEATVANYIGEMCRYLLAVPPGPDDTRHRLRKMFGNGLRPQIWRQFVERFDIPVVNEFYGATEGNANIVNVDGTVGAIGFVSRIIPHVYPIALIKVDEFTGEPIRNAEGLCQRCEPGEPGVFIGKIQSDNPTRAFLGYVDKAASEKKIVRDVFSHGDSAFISGDILVSDEFGYLFFKDRTGDTFRWRGENVSTGEVEAAVSQIADQRDAVVYGVLVPHAEGRAGMCGVADPAGDLDLAELAAGLRRDLPPYARPVFVRVLKRVDMTGTFKMKKTDLQREGFDPRLIKDRLYYLDGKSGQYTELDSDVYDKINSGQIRL